MENPLDDLIQTYIDALKCTDDLIAQKKEALKKVSRFSADAAKLKSDIARNKVIRGEHIRTINHLKNYYGKEEEK